MKKTKGVITPIALKPCNYLRTLTTKPSSDHSLTPEHPTPSKTSTNAPEQQWYLQDGSTKIQVANTTLCLDAGTGRSNGSPLTVATCADGRAAQKWVYNTDSQIVLDTASGASEQTPFSSIYGRGKPHEVYICVNYREKERHADHFVIARALRRPVHRRRP